MVNEAFGENFTKEAEVKIRDSKNIVQKPDDSLERREVDGCVELSEERGAPVTKRYHFECETWYDAGIVRRNAEYDSIIAMNNAEKIKGGIVLKYPESAVIFLRPDDRIPGMMEITHYAQSGSHMAYQVPFLQVGNYTVEEIFGKRLLILLPFYLFRYVNEFERMEKEPTEREALEAELAGIGSRLEELVKAGELSVYQQRTVLRLMLRVSDKLTAEFEELRKGVNEVMRGYIARTDADDILDLGRSEGRKEGRKEGQQEVAGLMRYLFSNNRSEDAVRAANDRNYMNELLSKYQDGVLAAR